MKNILRNAVLAVVLCALPAMAGRDIYLLGDGSDGPLDVTTSRTINSYAQVTTDVGTGATEILVDTNAGFDPGDLVLVHQSTGYTPEPAPGDISDIPINTGAVGRWELARLSTATAEPGKLKLDAPLLYAYTATGAQAVKVPEYTNVTIRSFTALTATPWNGSKGGILAFLANGAVVSETGGALNVAGQGFQGGQYIKDTTTGRRACTSIIEGAPGGAQRGEGVARGLFGTNSTGRGNGANGGGGGVCYLAGGAGGGSAGRGGDGGKTHSSADNARAVGGIGGSKFSSSIDPINRMLFGGGGGAGHGIVDSTARGGRGGGIIFIRAQSLSGDGTILANGNSGPSTTDNALSGAFGGGGGGTVYLRFAQLANCNVLSQGGRGGDTSLDTAFIGPGGGGGGGFLLLQSQTGSCGTFVNGANAGQTPTQRPGDTVNYGASAGGSGQKREILNDGFPATMPAPVVVTPANGSSTSNQRPTFSGTLDPSFPDGSQIILMVTSGATTLTFTLPAAANWSFTPPADLAVGSYTVSAVLTKQEVYSLQSNTNAFTIDITAPVAPVVSTPANGSRTNDTTPTYTGTAEPGSSVTIFVDGNPLGPVTADASGNWTFTPTTPLAGGSHTVNATATDPAGNISPASNTNTFTVDTTPPTVVVVTPAEGSSTNDTTPTYSGTVTDNGPGPFTVEIRVDGALVTTLTGVAGPDWTFTPTTPLPQGPHTVMATATDAAGNTATDLNAFTVDTTAPAVVVTTPVDGTTINDNTPEYSGTVMDNNPGPFTVEIRVDGVLVTTLTNVAGPNWSFTPTTPLANGPHTVNATATDPAGNISPVSNTNTFTVDTAPPTVVVLTPVEGTTINDNTPTYSGTAEPGSSVAVRVDGTLVGTVTADADGNWTLTPAAGLPNGPHTVTATATDAVGNSATDSNTFTVNVVNIPVAPVITDPPPGTVTDDNTPTISGTAPPNSTVTVLVDGTPVGTTTSDAAGNWTFTPTTPVATGPHDFTATTTDGAGTTSPESNIVPITITPNTTIVSGPPSETDSTSATFDFSSTEPGVTYECKLDNATDFSPCTDPVTFENLAPGPHTLEVRAKDSAGNVDPTPATATWTVVLTGGDRDFLGDGIGCAASGGNPSALAMMGLGLIAVLMGRRRRQ